MKICTFVLAVLALAFASGYGQPPTITNQPVGRAVWLGCNASFAVGASGAGPLTYQWLLNGTNLPNGIITTVAGNGATNEFGDGGPATNASFHAPNALALDTCGNIYFPEANNRVREVRIDGVITTVAGNGIKGYTGDGGAATNASLSLPQGVAVDAAGDLFISDFNNNVVRKVDTNRVITTVAGNGNGGFSGDGGQAIYASLDGPIGLALDAAGDLFIADLNNHRVRELSTNGTIYTIAGNGQWDTLGQVWNGIAATNASFYGPAGVAVDAVGNLFIADNALSGAVYKVSTNGIITTVAGGGTNFPGTIATNASVVAPTGVVVDSSGDVFIAQGYPGAGGNAVREVNSQGNIATVAGNFRPGYAGDGGAATNANLYGPQAVALDSFGNLFVADGFNNRIRKVDNTQRPALGLNNSMPGNAGEYQVVVTGSGGSVTSSVATLTVAAEPLIYGTVRNADASLTLSCVSPPSSTNILFFATSLTPPISWRTLSTNVAGADGSWQFIDTNAAACQARFYSFVLP